MEALRTLQITIEGTRDRLPLRPERLEIDELIRALEHSRDLIAPEAKSRPDIHVQLSEGSVLLRLTTAAKAVIAVQALLAEVQQTFNRAILSPKQVEALSFFSKLAQKEDFKVSFGAAEGKPVLTIAKDIQWLDQDEETWVGAERYITGIVTNIGGKTQPNVHIDTDDPQLGTLIVKTSEALLAEDRKNRLYKPQQLRISIRQNLASGAYDLKSAALIQFVDYELATETEDAYLDRLIEEATPHWEKVGDPEAWLKTLRGYEQ